MWGKELWEGPQQPQLQMPLQPPGSPAVAPAVHVLWISSSSFSHQTLSNSEGRHWLLEVIRFLMVHWFWDFTYDSARHCKIFPQHLLALGTG